MDPVLQPDEIEEQEAANEPGRSSRVVFWLVVVGLAGLFLPLYLIGAAIKDNTQTLRDQIAQIDQQEADLSQPGSDQQTLQDELLAARQQLETLSAVNAKLLATHIDWPAVMAVIGNNGYVQMDLISLSQADDQIMLRGQAGAESVVMAYSRMLEESGQFSRVIVQSISLKTLPTPTPPPTTVPSTTPTPSGVEPTPQPLPVQVVEFVILVECASQGGIHE
jgi:Tfp pilus assembly protein PilN